MVSFGIFSHASVTCQFHISESIHMNSKLTSVFGRKDNILNSKLEDNFIPDKYFVISSKIVNSISRYSKK